MNQQNPFKEYGMPTIIDAIENLAIAFMAEGLQGPIKIVLPKGTLHSFKTRIQVQQSVLENKSFTKEQLEAKVINYASCSNNIEFVEE